MLFENKKITLSAIFEKSGKSMNPAASRVNNVVSSVSHDNGLSMDAEGYDEEETMKSEKNER